MDDKIIRMICRNSRKDPRVMVEIRIPLGIGVSEIVIAPDEKEAYAHSRLTQPSMTTKKRDVVWVATLNPALAPSDR